MIVPVERQKLAKERSTDDKKKTYLHGYFQDTKKQEADEHENT